MCEIFFAMATEGTELDEDTLWEVAGEALYSSISNPDGWGAFNQDRRVMKSPGFFEHTDARDFVKEYIGSEWVVLHLRFATSGYLNDKNTHPYTMRGLTVCHNGIVDVDGIDIGNRWDSPKTQARKGKWAKRSDTWAMLHAIVGAPGETTAEKIERSFDGMDGSFSVFLMDDDHELFYFRDLSSFTFMLLPDDNLIMGATNRRTLEAMTWGNDTPFTTDKPEFITPEGEIIYSLSVWEGLTAIGKFDNRIWGSGGGSYISEYDLYGYGGHYGYHKGNETALTVKAEVVDLTGPEPREDRESLDEWLFLQKHYGPAPDDGGRYDPDAVALAELNAEREMEWMAKYEAGNRKIAAASAEAERKAEALREIQRLEEYRTDTGYLTREESDRELEAMRNLFGQTAPDPKPPLDPAVQRWVDEEREFERQVEARIVDEAGMAELLSMLPAAPLVKPSTRTLEVWQRLDDFVAKRPKWPDSRRVDH